MHKHEMSEFVDPAGDRVTRRIFLGGAAAAAALAPSLKAGHAAQPAPESSGRKIKLGVVGCGGRGSWIADLFQKHGGYEIHALADYFPDLVQRAGDALKVDRTRRFSGLSGYKRVIDSGVDAIALIHVPYFFPEQATAAVEAGCHVYLAKPIAVDVPGCLAIEAAGKRATEKKRCFLVDYQLPTEPANIEVAKRIREGALGRLAHIHSTSQTSIWADPPKGPTIENRLRDGIWCSDRALGGDGIVAYDIHIIDGVTWVMGKRPVSACGRSRTCRPDPHGDRTDCTGVVYEYDDGVFWTHMTQSLANNQDFLDLAASFYGLVATGHIQYGGKVYIRGGTKHYSGTIGSIYDQGAIRNIADFHRNITAGNFQNPTVRRAVDGTLTAILGREAAARGRFMTMDDLVRENRKLEIDLRGLRA